MSKITTPSQRALIIQLAAITDLSQADIANQAGVSLSTVSRIARDVRIHRDPGARIYHTEAEARAAGKEDSHASRDWLKVVLDDGVGPSRIFGDAKSRIHTFLWDQSVAATYQITCILDSLKTAVGFPIANQMIIRLGLDRSHGIDFYTENEYGPATPALVSYGFRIPAFIRPSFVGG